MGSCCASKIPPEWNHYCYRRFHVDVDLKIWDGEKVQSLSYGLYKFSEGTEVPWGNEIKNIEDLQEWLTDKFNKDIWPNHKDYWRQSNEHAQYKVFKQEEPPKLHQIQAGFDGFDGDIVINKKNDWINGSLKMELQKEKCSLSCFCFVVCV